MAAWIRNYSNNESAAKITLFNLVETVLMRSKHGEQKDLVSTNFQAPGTTYSLSMTVTTTTTAIALRPVLQHTLTFVRRKENSKNKIKNINKNS
jgi:hypothetical protein